MNRVMVVEDEHLVAYDIAASLSSMGYDVTATAASAEECLRHAATERPDLVLMDIHLSGEADGVDAAALLRERYDVPVVYLTAYADQETLKRAKLTVPLGYVVKPFRESELRSAVEVGIFRHQVERRLQERERWFASTINAIGDGVLAIDADQNILLLNPAAERLLRTSVGALQGRPAAQVLRFIDETTLTELPSPLSSAMESREVVRLQEGVLLDVGGVRIPIEDSIAPIVDKRGRLLGAVMIFQDLTEKRRTRERVSRAERLAALGTLAAGVGHEINNPLTYVMGNVTFATQGLMDVQKWLESNEARPRELVVSLRESLVALHEVNDGAERIGRVISELRGFARRETETVGDVNEAVRWAMRVAEHHLPSGARTVVELGAVPRVAGSGTRIGQLVLNLAINAMHAMQARPDVAHELRVTTEHHTQEDTVVISVQDTGCGMDKATLSHAFEPFFTTKAQDAGTGMGLFICSTIAREMGGRIDVESDPGRGTKFEIRLPAQRDRTDPLS